MKKGFITTIIRDIIKYRKNKGAYFIMVEYSSDGKFAYYKGLKFTRDDRTGYFLNSTTRQRLHRCVYAEEVGEIPAGKNYHIHHIDGNKMNNEPHNLKLTTNSKHTSYHSNKRIEENSEYFEKFQKAGIAEAPKWHSSKEGKEWHKKHYEANLKDKLQIEKSFNCEQCGNEFLGKNNGRNRFCSAKCRSKWRRDNKLDDVDRECSVCGSTFRTHKYDKVKTCSKECQSISYRRSRGWA